MTELVKVTIGNNAVEGVYMGSSLIFEDWTPLSLFSVSGTKGAWYDFTDITTLYQDSSLSTPVNYNGDPVGGVRDKSGTAPANLYNTVSANRPTYNSSGKGSVKFNGINSFLYSFNADMDKFGNFCIAYSDKKVADSSAANTSSIFCMGSENGWAVSLNINSSNNFNVSDGNIRFSTFLITAKKGTEIHALGASTYYQVANTWESVIVETGNVGNLITHNGNNVPYNQNKIASYGTNFSPLWNEYKNTNYRIGTANSPTNKFTYLNGDISTVIILNRNLTVDERVKLNRYLGKTR